MEARSAKWKSRLADFRESLTHTLGYVDLDRRDRAKKAVCNDKCHSWELFPRLLGLWQKAEKITSTWKTRSVKRGCFDIWLLIIACRLTRSLKTRFAAFITDALVCLVFLVTFTTLYKESKKKFSIDFVSLETLLFYSSLLKKDPSSFLSIRRVLNLGIPRSSSSEKRLLRISTKMLVILYL